VTSSGRSTDWRQIFVRVAAEIGGPLITVLAVIAVERLRWVGVSNRDSDLILLLAVGIAGTVWGWRSGLVSAAIALGYWSLATSAPDRLFAFSPRGTGRVVLMALTVFPLAIVTAYWHGRLTRAQTALAIATTRLQRASSRDPLTGLLDKRGFARAIAAEIARSEQRPRSFAVLLADLDGLKNLNARLGNATADVVVEVFAGALDIATRDSDIGARLGDDVFSVLLSESDESGAGAASQRITKIFSGELQQVLPTVSAMAADFGVSVFPRDGKTPADLLRAAELEKERARRERSGALLAAGPI
jgi:diguanylate cyclase (GGDEF)-like protein